MDSATNASWLLLSFSKCVASADIAEILAFKLVLNAAKVFSFHLIGPHWNIWKVQRNMICQQ
jgi:hypothetical protein